MKQVKLITHGSSIDVAFKLLALVQKKCKHLKNPTGEDLFDLQAFSNGREQGFHIRGIGLSNHRYLGISFAQNRNSDNIVVYYGENFYPELDKMKASWFPPGDYEGASEYIIRLMQGFIDVAQRQKKSIKVRAS
jgi:hypothetical protein